MAFRSPTVSTCQDYGNVEGTRRHRMLLTGVYQLPLGSGRAFMNGGGWKNALLGGWDVTNVTLLETGPWLTPSISGSFDQSNTNVANRGAMLRPDVVSKNYYSGQSQGAVLQPGGICSHAGRCGTLRQCGSRHLAGAWDGGVSLGLAKTLR